MSKNRQRVVQVGAKSIAIKTKHKIGGRKSGLGTNTMSLNELISLLESVQKRDRNKLRRAIESRGVILPS